MQSTRDKCFSLFLALVLGGAGRPALGDDTCVDLNWDVSQERALFAETPAEVTAGKDPRSAPGVVPNRLYSLRLAAQDSVGFPVNPAKKMPPTPAYAGLATL